MKATEVLARVREACDSDSWHKMIFDELILAVNDSAVLTKEQGSSVEKMVNLAVAMEKENEQTLAFLQIPAIAAYINTCHE